MAANPYEINYDDKRFSEVETDKQAALSDVEKTYGDMISQSDKYYNDLVNQSKDWADKQAQIQNEQTDFAIEKIEQQKEQAEKDYIKEQSGAYVDWQKESDRYGANAETMAQNGLAASGYSETAQVNFYNTYQNRVMVARDAISRATLNYDNGMKEARLQNSAALAEIYANAYEKQLTLALQGFQQKNELIREKTNQKLAVDEMYYGRYRDVLNQINTENSLAEQVRQANLDEKYRRDSLAEQIRQANLDDKYRRDSLAASNSSSGGGGSSGGSSGGKIIKENSSNFGSNIANAVKKIKDAAADMANNAKNAVDKAPLLSKISKTDFTYATANAFLKNNGLNNNGLRLLTSSEWSKAKKAGEQGSELEYNSYQEYVKNYLKWCVNES